jgi:hypothetical protein
MAHANADLRQAQADASVCANSAGVPSLSSPISASTAISPGAESTPGELRPGDDVLSQLQSDAAVGADSAGASLLSPISETLPDAESTLGENLSPLEDLITSAERDVEAAAAKLAADAAAASAELAASQAAVSPIPPPPPAALKEPERAQLKLSGPIMQVPEMVLRVFHLYEKKHVQPLLKRLTLLRC